VGAPGVNHAAGACTGPSRTAATVDHGCGTSTAGALRVISQPWTDPVLRPVTRLRSGRLPTGPHEAAVTPRLARALPRGATITLGTDPEPVRVVGVAAVPADQSDDVVLAGPGHPTPTARRLRSTAFCPRAPRQPRCGPPTPCCRRVPRSPQRRHGPRPPAPSRWVRGCSSAGWRCSRWRCSPGGPRGGRAGHRCGGHRRVGIGAQRLRAHRAPRTRRRVAAAQAVLVAGLGSALGILAGLVPAVGVVTAAATSRCSCPGRRSGSRRSAYPSGRRCSPRR